MVMSGCVQGQKATLTLDLGREYPPIAVYNNSQVTTTMSTTDKSPKGYRDEVKTIRTDVKKSSKKIKSTKFGNLIE